MVHGLGGSIRSWDLIAPALSQSRQLVLIDLPGHGMSPPIHGRQTIAAFADEICKFLEDQGLGGIDLVGSSVGALVGGAILGMLTSLTTHYFGAEYQKTIAIGLLILLLVVRPQGLFGTTQVRQV